MGAAADRVRRPLAFYAWLEIGIAIYAFLFPLYFEICYKVYVSLARGLCAGASSLLVLKFVFSFSLVLIPTVLMGATFPALTRFVTHSIRDPTGLTRPGAFEQDVMAPRVVLTLMIEHLYRTRQAAVARAWVKAAREQKYLEHDSNYYLPLERVCRKVMLNLAAPG